MKEGNGKNRIWIELKCEYRVSDDEWAIIWSMVNSMLQNHDGGRFANVGAYLCEEETNDEDKP